jgi:VIT1/CCC1 family predicted Fe2+/Mn2+ transporter
MFSQTKNRLGQSPQLTRILSDFTLGFSDGLTVPFALTAGLSSLGSSNTVIYAGLAELCAGSISMGISGYLAALDELPCPPPATNTENVLPSHRESSVGARGRRSGDEEEAQGMLRRVSSSGSSSRVSAEEKRYESNEEDHVRRYLEPLSLSDKTISFILEDLRLQPGGLPNDIFTETATSHDTTPITPITSGLAISAGYILGAIIPLTPYFFAPTVGVGLQWSIGLCLLALWLFGSGKSWFLSSERRLNWKLCFFKGMQMMVLGGVAAAAAVVCVKLLDSDGAGEAESG